MVITSPGWSVNDTPLTALTVPSRLTKRTARSSSSTAAATGGSAKARLRLISLGGRQMTGDRVPGRPDPVQWRGQGRDLFRAHRLGEGAARAEAAARRRV